MPHCVIEYSNDLNDKISKIVNAVHLGTLSSNLFEEDDIKTRAICYEHYRVGISNSSFIHVSSKILSGRNTAQKSTLNAAIIKHITNLNIKDCSITAEVIDIHKESYEKNRV